MEFVDRLICGDSGQVLKQLPDKCIQMGFTSPPYYGMRKYSGEPVIFGGEEGCPHEWSIQKPPNTKMAKQGSTETAKHPTLVEKMGKIVPGATCVRCDAFYGFLGLEPTPERYIANLVSLFREFRRVLRDDGTLWVNIADSYNGSGGAGGDYNPGGLREGQPRYPGRHVASAKPKDLLGIPFMLALALREDGWWLRSTVIWAKPNCFPESVTDRPTNDFEYIFLLAKNGAKPIFWTHRDGPGSRTKPKADYRWYDHEGSAELETEPANWRSEKFVTAEGEKKRRYSRYNLWRGHPYYYNAEAIREPYKESSIIRVNQKNFHNQKGGPKDYKHGINPNRSMRNTLENFKNSANSGRNKRAVWKVPTTPSVVPHFAQFPEGLLVDPILAGSSDKACPHCGAAWFPRKKKTGVFQRRWGTGNADGSPYNQQSSMQAVWEDCGLHPTCECEDNDGSGASLVCDPFAGVATTCAVAKQLGRHFVGIDVSSEYVAWGNRKLEQTEKRTEQLVMQF